MALVVGLVGTLAVGGMLSLVLTRRMPGASEPAVTHDYFREPSVPGAILAAEVGAPVQAYSLRYMDDMVEAYVEDDGRRRRFTIYDDGRIMSRGGAGARPATPPFDLSSVPLDRLPQILRAAREAISGPAPSSARLARADDGAVVWHVVFWTNAGSQTVQVTFDGTVRAASDVAPPIAIDPDED